MRMSGSARWQGEVRSILRIVAGILFASHGAQKLLGWFGGLGGHTARVGSEFWVAGLIETVGGALIILGLFTRPVAFILCGEMAVAYFKSHFPRGFWPIRNGGELAVLFCFLFLYFFVAGPGPISLDRLMRRSE